MDAAIGAAETGACGRSLRPPRVHPRASCRWYSPAGSRHARNIMGVALVGGMLFATLLGIFVPRHSTISWGASGIPNSAANAKTGKTMKTQLTIAAAVLTLAACTTCFLPRQRSTLRRLRLRRRLPRDTTGVGERLVRLFGDTPGQRSNGRWRTTATAVAAARVEAGLANLKTVRAQYLPQMGIGVTAEGEYTPQTKIADVCRRTVAWEIALFGALRNAKRAARAQIAASEWALAGVRLSLGFAGGRHDLLLTLLEYERDLAIARPDLRLRRESAALIDSMFRWRHVGRRGAGLRTQPGLYGRGGASRSTERAVFRRGCRWTSDMRRRGRRTARGALRLRQTTIPPTFP